MNGVFVVTYIYLLPDIPIHAVFYWEIYASKETVKKGAFFSNVHGTSLLPPISKSNIRFFLLFPFSNIILLHFLGY